MLLAKLALVLAALVLADEPAPEWYMNMPAGTPKVLYWPGMWAPQPDWGQFRLGYWPKDSLVVSWTVYNSEPEIGYPYHYGTVSGINDTVKVRMYFDNRTNADYYLGSESPEDWFFPVLFDPAADVFKSISVADTSVFSYRFEHWIDMQGDVITEKPDTIRSRNLHLLAQPRGMIYSLWGINSGTYRVIMKATYAKPSAVELVLDNPYNVFTITTAQSVLDSVNAYCYVAVNALLRREFTLFWTNVDSVFHLNAQSIPGWALKYSGYEAQGDTAAATTAIDSLLYLGNNNLDPFVPDSSSRTEYHNAWLQDYLHNYPFAKWRLEYPEASKHIIFE